ncbi:MULTISPECIES: alpha/beta hydrolase [Pseudomonas]|uniref:alpha/beta hydrolase n=1 Tax=Pseudomonas TaxID=286 RepID=UPI000F56801F|nr:MULTISPECIES: alpha/beta fold hydrolase [Pseudomonas]AZF15606.1 Hydrolase, alpha/beta fold family [Pseudomonas sp. R3-18-08]MDQ0980391.1 dipeptidyl aminopeptidase/acylaminoacyl peptidase [Pseudomonas synxantha]
MSGFESVSVSSGGEQLAVRIYPSTSVIPAPVLVLCHGFCGIQNVVLPEFAFAFAQAGYNVITFDYRGFGESGGERGRLQTKMQIEDIHAVVNWVSQQPSFDTSRIGLWGTSLGGCHVITVGAQNPLVKCIISQTAFADGEILITSAMSIKEESKLFSTLNRMQEKKESSGRELFVPPLMVLDDEQSRVFFEKHQKFNPQLNTKIPFLTVREIINYKPVIMAMSVRQPVLVVAAEHDIVNPPDQAVRLYEALHAEKTIIMLEGAGHYDVYEGDTHFKVLRHQINWLGMYL